MPGLKWEAMYCAQGLRVIRVPLFLLFSLLLSSPVCAQATSNSGPGSSTASFVTNVDEVSIDFVVRNRKKLASDLKPEDVVLTDDGSAVKLSDIRLITGQSGAQHLITLLFDPLDPSAATNAREVATKILKLIPVNEFSFSIFKIDQRLRLLQEFTTDRLKIQQAIRAATNDGSSNDQTDVLAKQKLISDVQSRISQETQQASANDRALEK